MKERPILFSAPMIRAILAGTKSQTRRIVNPQPERRDPSDGHGDEFMWPSTKCRSMVTLDEMRCLGPYGARGDRLWVKETWRTSLACDGKPPSALGGHGWPIWYEADGSIAWFGARDGGPAFTTPGKTRVSIHMPRWASRILLEITEVRVQRLHEIAEDDARAEGVEPFPFDPEGDCWSDGKHRTAYNFLWNEINGWNPNSWDSNPWVWCLTFKRVEPAR